MINVFYGRESVDKANFIFDNISGEAIVLVPDQYTLEAEKDAFRYLDVKGFMDKEILGFSRLCDRIADECGRDRRTLIDKYGRHMLLSRILEKNSESLDIYRNMNGNAGFIEMVNNFLAQIRQNNVSCEMLKAIAETVPESSLLKRKLHDLCLIYEAYEEAIKDKYIDSEMYIDSIIERMDESDYLKGKHVWIYGFETFTEKNLDMLRKLAVLTSYVNVVLSHAKGCADASLFELTGIAIEKLKSIALEEGIEYMCCEIEGYERKVSPALSHLEKQLYSIPAAKSENCEGITIVSAANIYGEAETAASYILSLVRDKGLKFSDIALICNNMENDQPVISRVFERYGIPLFVDQKRKVSASNIAAFVMSALAVISKGYENQDMFRMLKTGLAGFEDDEVEELENYAIKYRIKGSGWKKDFSKGVKEYSEEDFDRLKGIRARLMEKLLAFDEEFKKDRTMSSRIRALYDFMTVKCNVLEKVREETERLSEEGYADEAAHTSQVWNILCSLLGQIDELIGDQKVNNDELYSMLAAGLSEAETGIIPQTIDGVSAGTCQRSRYGNIKALVVMSADEGVLPQNASSDELLNNDELLALEENNISLLKMDSIRTAEEAMGIYRTFAEPTEYLWIGTAAVDAGGNSIKPSPVIATMKRIFPGLKESPDILNSGNPIDLISSPESTKEHLASAMRETLDGRELHNVFKETAGWMNRADGYSLENIERGLFYSAKLEKVNREKAISLYSRGREALSLSPSALEKYGRCPFAYFINYGLSPKERRVFEMAGREIGDVYHEVLMKLSNALTEDGIALTSENSKWMTISREDYDDLIKSIIAGEIGGYREGILSYSNEEKYRMDRLSDIAGHIGWVLIEQVRAGDIKEAAFEERFARGKVIPPLEIKADDKTVYVEGIIDRIDVLSNDSIKIIDYKTGVETFSTKEAVKGWKLQLMVYLAAGLKYGNIERRPAGVFYFRIEEPMIDKSKDKRSDEPADISKEFKLEGAIVNDPVAIRSIAGDFSGRSEIVQIMRTKEGELKGTSEERLFEPEEFDSFMEDVEGTVKNICKGIVTGEISPAPKKKNHQMSSCTYCQYKSICRFDTVFKDCRYEWI